MTTWKTPSGSPASRMISAIRSVVSGVVSAGFATTVLPQTSAGPELVAEQRGREVPRHDRDDDAERPLEDEPVRALVEVRDVRAAEALREPRVVLERVDEARDLDPGLAQRLALLERQLQRELVRAARGRASAACAQISPRLAAGVCHQPGNARAPARRPRRPPLRPACGTRPTSSPDAGLRMTVTPVSAAVAITLP